MSISEEIGSVVESQLSEDQFLIDVILKGNPGSQKLIVLVDSDTGMTIAACTKLSRDLSDYLENRDLIGSSFTLEVSSPGLDHPLKLKRQFSKNIGRGLKVLTNDHREIEGTLRNVGGEQINIELRSGRKGKELDWVDIPFADIVKAMVLVSFKK